MVKRFRMVAGPNGSGKSTLVRRLRDDYSVNFYTFVNADEILAQVSRTGAVSVVCAGYLREKKVEKIGGGGQWNR